jgi:tape measure domain-containing protein
MSFGSGGTLNVGVLQAQFVLNASAAQGAIAQTITQTNTLKQAFSTTNILKIDNRQAVQAIQQTTGALDTFKKGLELIGAYKVFGLLEEGVKSLGDSIIGMNAKLQQSQTAFTALTGSAQTATTLVGQLETLASHSTFGLAQLQGAAQQMIAFGVATANVPPLLQSVQNAAAASGGDINDKFQRISYVISELSSGMQLSERQLRQLAQAGVPLTAIAQQLGITVEQLQNAGKTGEVTSAQVVAAFQKVYTSGNLGDFMSKQAQTFSGAMNLIRTNLSLAVAQGFQPLFQSISNVAVKIGQFVQTATFQQWVAGLRAAVTEAVAVLKSFMAVLGPIGDAIAKVFGLNTANISAEMNAVKNATVDVGQYNAALQAGGGAADDTKAQLAEYKNTVDQASLALVGLNDQLAQNKIALDANARSIQAVKNQYDPIIKNATQQIRDINILTPDELSRKQRELELDRDRARLELTRPDTSSFDRASSPIRRRWRTCRGWTRPNGTTPSPRTTRGSRRSRTKTRRRGCAARFRPCRTRSAG